MSDLHLHVTIVKIPFLADWKTFVFSKWPHSKSWLQLFRVASKAKLFASLKKNKSDRVQTSDEVTESCFEWHSFMFLMLFGSNSARKSHFSAILLECDGRTDRQTDRQTDGRTHPLTEMRERL